MSALVDSPGRTGLPDGFVDVATAAYRDDARWIPEDAGALASAFGPDNAWFDTGEARCFCVPGVARLAVFKSPSMVVDGEPVAFFGYWETVSTLESDPEADAVVFRAAEAWARERGATRLFGPIAFSTYGRYRVRTSAETGAVTFQDEPYNPAHYPELLARHGYEVAHTYVTQRGTPDTVRARYAAKHELLPAVRSAGYEVRALTPEVWLDRLGDLYEIVDTIFSRNFAYTPIPRDVFERVCGEAFIRRTCPHTSAIVLAPDGAVAGFGLVYPNYGPLLVQGRGDARVEARDLSYAEHAEALHALGPVDVLPKTYGVHPEHRRRGLQDAMGIFAIEGGLERYDHWMPAMIRADNLSRRFAAETQDQERWYALYARPL